MNIKTIPDYIEERIKGKTLDVYLYILKKGNVGVREVQRALKFSSSSLAIYHIEKLVELGVVDRDPYGRYFLVKKPSLNEMKPFVQMGRIVVPRLLFYAIVFSTLSVFYILFGTSWSYLFALVAIATAAAIFWYEAFTIWKIAPLAFEFKLHHKFTPLIAVKRLGMMPFAVIGVLAITFLIAGLHYLDASLVANPYYADEVASFTEQMVQEQHAHTAIGVAPHGMASLAPGSSFSWLMILPLAGVFAVTIVFLRLLA